MTADFLRRKFACPDCGTIRLRIPRDVDATTPIHCQSCDRLLGVWGVLVEDYRRETGDGAFFIHDDRFDREPEIEPEKLKVR